MHRKSSNTSKKKLKKKKILDPIFLAMLHEKLLFFEV
jgi:hypothetical protein